MEIDRLLKISQRICKENRTCLGCPLIVPWGCLFITSLPPYSEYETSVDMVIIKLNEVVEKLVKENPRLMEDD